MALNDLSAADVAAITGKNADMFGGGAWWLIVLFLFVFMGWGGNGYNNGGAAQNYTLASDFATLQRQIDAGNDRILTQGNGIGNGLCDGFYTQAQLVNGVNLNMANGFAQAQLERSNGAMNTMNAINALGTQMQNCCCQNRYDALQNNNALQSAIQNGFCQTNFNMQNGTRDIIENANINTRAILDAMNTNRVEQLKEKICEQNNIINGLNLAASQQAQNAYLISQLKTT